jgi:hypothetical protein
MDRLVLTSWAILILWMMGSIYIVNGLVRQHSVDGGLRPGDAGSDNIEVHDH